MAIPAAAVWEVRPTVGSDTNGGGFVTGASGTDFSQQDAANSGASNKSTTDAVGIGTTTVTSATANFTSAIVGNIIYLDGGWYEVVTFTNSTTIVVDRSTPTGTGLAMNIGGALATIAQANTNAVAQNNVYVKATGTYTVTTALVLALVNGTAFNFIGYSSTRGDVGQVIWTTATSSIHLIEAGSGNPTGYCFQNFIFTNTASSTPGDCFHASSSTAKMWRLRNCIIGGGFNVGVNGNYSVDYNFESIVLESCEVKNCVSHGIFNTGVTVLLGCTVFGNGGDGVRQNPASGFNCSLFAVCCAIKSNTGNGFYYTGTDSISLPVLINCDVISNGGDGVNQQDTGAPGGLVVWNSILDSNTGYAVNWALSANFVGLLGLLDNFLRNNTAGNYNNCSGDPSDIIGTADPFTNRGATPPDLSLNSTTGGGAACKGAATPGTLPFS